MEEEFAVLGEEVKGVLKVEEGRKAEMEGEDNKKEETKMMFKFSSADD